MSTTQRYLDELLEVQRYVDGDTFWTWVDLGYYSRELTHCRLYNIDCPELHRPKSDYELEKAREAAQLTQDFYDDLGVLTYWQWGIGHDPDDFGRWLVMVWKEDAQGNRTYLHQLLLDAELAVVSPGGKIKWRDTYDTSS